MHAGTESLETRLFSTYWDDGLLDLFAGLGTMGIGLSWWFGLVPLGAVLPAVLVPLWTPLRRRLVEPRAGHVVFSGEREVRNRRWLTMAFVLGVLSLVTGVAVYMLITPDRGGLMSVLIPGLPSVLIGALTAIVAVSLRLVRFFVYTQAFVAAGVIVAVLGTRPEYGMLAGAALMLLNGTRMLATFLRQEPVEPEGI